MTQHEFDQRVIDNRWAT